MASRSIEAGRAFMRLSINDEAFRRGLLGASRRLQAFGRSVAGIGGAFTGLGAALAAPLAGAVRVFQRYGDELDKISARTGVSVEALSELRFAAEQSGAGIGSVETVVRALQRSLIGADRGLSTAVDSLERLGLSFDDLRGLAPEEQFTIVADRLGGVADASEKAGIALQLLGRSGTQLIPLFGNVRKLRQEASELGLTIDTETAKAAADLTDAFNRVRSAIRASAVAIGTALSPALERVAQLILPIGTTVVQWAKANAATVQTVAALSAATAAFGLALLGLGGALTAGGFALTNIASGASIVAAVLGTLLSPVALLTAAAAGLGAAFVDFGAVASGPIALLRQQFGPLIGIVQTTIAGIRDALSSGELEAAGEVATAGLRAAFTEASIGIRSVWAKVQSFLTTAWFDTIAAIVVASSRVQEAWATVNANVQSVWAKTQNFVTTQVLKAQKVITEKLTGEEFDISVELNASEKALTSSLDRINRKLEQTVSSLRDEEQAVLEEINNKERDRQSQLDAELRSAVEAAAAAKQRLSELAAESGKAAAAQQKAVEQIAGGAGPGGGIAGALKQAAFTIREGAFGGRGLNQRGSQTLSVAQESLAVQKRQLAAQEQTVETLGNFGLVGV
jgi:chemotaxis regulatin CheY-phosphate phosphatase CheZ